MTTRFTKQDFFKAMFSNTDGLIEIREIYPDKKVQQSFYSNIEGASNHSQNGGNLYFGVCPRVRESGKEEDVAKIASLWIDLDEYDEQKALNKVQTFKYQPSVIVASGNGFHCYWLLKEAESVDKKTKGILKGLSQVLGGDKTFDLARVLRVPDTLNVKDPNNPKEVKVISFDPDKRYNLSDFEEFEVPVTTNGKHSVTFTEPVKEIDLNALKIPFQTKLDVQSNVPIGRRSDVDFKVCCALFKAGIDDNTIRDIYRKYPIGAKYREQGERYLQTTIANAKIKIAREMLNGETEKKTEPMSDEKNSVQRKEPVDGASTLNPGTGELFTVEKGKVKWVSTNVADRIAKDNIIFSGGEFYQYKDGCYRPLNEISITKNIKDIIGEGAGKNQAEEIIYWLRSETYIEEDNLNNSKYINLKNGLFDLETKELHPHTPDIYSTIQLNVNYDKDAWCNKWLKALQEIFKGDEFKMETLQEFFGLCLTRETKHNKALMCIGEGNNGKSVVLKTLEALLGRDNFANIPLERFSSSFYIANLLGKLANISIETHAKSEVYDSTFKAITSGDSIPAEKKFKTPFSFRPFCKLVFAMNNLPRVDDKTNAFFNRLLIIRFDREFTEEEQNKALSQELLKELDGIFLWALEGLRNLSERGYFRRNEEMEGVIKEYRRENNNVLVFVDEECQLEATSGIEKDVLYAGYKNFCLDNGYRALSKKRFGMELAKQYKLDSNSRDHKGQRVWQGICTTYRKF
jgi:putative DNA primase/helicase